MCFQPRKLLLSFLPADGAEYCQRRPSQSPVNILLTYRTPGPLRPLVAGLELLRQNSHLGSQLPRDNFRDGTTVGECMQWAFGISSSLHYLCTTKSSC
jgi:hypothetical protein